MPHSEVPVLTLLAGEPHREEHAVRDLQLEVPADPGKEDGIMEDPKILDALEERVRLASSDLPALFLGHEMPILFHETPLAPKRAIRSEASPNESCGRLRVRF